MPVDHYEANRRLTQIVRRLDPRRLSPNPFKLLPYPTLLEPVAIEGEITGKKGASIQVHVLMGSDDFKKIRKIEARPAQKEKDKAKK